MPKVNPDILRWARETAGLSLEEAAAKLSIRAARGRSPEDRLADLEAGEVEPSRPMLVRMAKQYRRPILTFYMSGPPRPGDRGRDFRTLPDDHSPLDEGLLDALIRDVQARQGLVRAVLEEEDDVVHVPFVGSLTMDDGIVTTVAAIREIVPLDLYDFRSESSPAKAFASLRNAVEQVGVYVLLMGDLGSYHTAIDLQTFRGFAIADDVAPFIVINDRDSRAAWSFTLLHELTHLLLGQTGISAQRAEHAIEQFCNDVASEFLLPSEEMDELDYLPQAGADALQQVVSEFAGERNISSSMVAYRLYRAGSINYQQWERLARALRGHWMDARDARRERAQAQRGGPSYYVLRRHRLGNALIESVSRMLRGGDLSTSKAGRVLGVKPQQVQALLDLGGSARDRPPA